MLSDHDIFQRYKTKCNEFAKQTDITLIGHSLFDMWDELPSGTPALSGKTVANLGISGVSTRQYLDVIVKPQHIHHLGQSVFIFLGVNDICKEPDYSPSKVMEWINEILQHFQSIAPKSNYYLLGATPVNNIKTVSNKEIKILNTYLKNYCPTHMTYIETESVFCNQHGELDTTLCTDGLHLNNKGYQLLKELLEQYS